MNALDALSNSPHPHCHAARARPFSSSLSLSLPSALQLTPGLRSRPDSKIQHASISSEPKRLFLEIALKLSKYTFCTENVTCRLLCCCQQFDFEAKMTNFQPRFDLFGTDAKSKKLGAGIRVLRTVAGILDNAERTHAAGRRQLWRPPQDPCAVCRDGVRARVA